ncbi:MAG: DNA-protecting protein DprA [Kiritimatiellae bacterium]|nr:DNA-protecting protein DprA [Kiritimatiellia bacterium]
MNEREAYIALNMMEKIGPVGVRALVEHVGSADTIFSCSEGDLLGAKGMGRETVRAVLEQRSTVEWEKEVDRAEALGARLVTMADAEYPPLLREIHDPPLALYVRGKLESRDRHSVAVVGTRRPSLYGRDTTDRLAYALAKAGMVVVSGLAEGIDTVAHEAALRAGGRTLAVIGSGMEHLYPASNRELAESIVSQGALISEFPLDRRPDKTTFPMRNRIVSGLSMGSLVVEAAARSGALITVSQALEQGRTVFAVPGRIDSNGSRGTNELLKQGARVVTKAEDILKEFEMLLPLGSPTMQSAGAPQPELTEKELNVVELLHAGRRDVDGLIRLANLSVADVNSVLMTLEMKRVVRMLPGRVVELASARG